jgi:hypothetical protein
MLPALDERIEICLVDQHPPQRLFEDDLPRAGVTAAAQRLESDPEGCNPSLSNNAAEDAAACRTLSNRGETVE